MLGGDGESMQVVVVGVVKHEDLSSSRLEIYLKLLKSVFENDL